MNLIPALSTTITFIFAFSVFRRYQRRHGTHLLLWSIGLLFYGLGTLSEVILSVTFNPWVLKLWYLTGAMLTAAWLGQGTVHLLIRRRGLASKLTAVLAVVSLLAAVLVFTAPVSDPSAYNPGEPVSAQYETILSRSGLTLILTILLNIYGTVTLVGGAIYSAYLFWRKKVLANRLYGNILIAAGALSPALGGTFIRLGVADWLYLSELVGAVVMYAGFLLATSEAPAAVGQAEAAISGEV
ncbi:MAG TPA: hypothetical protein VJ768_04800 [Anaerolineales bacterium]|nr:hypothetical protein [Anaerolineales bacterium]